MVASKAYLGSHARLVLQQDFGHTTVSIVSLGLNLKLINYQGSESMIVIRRRSILLTNTFDFRVKLYG